MRKYLALLLLIIYASLAAETISAEYQQALRQKSGSYLEHLLADIIEQDTESYEAQLAWFELAKLNKIAFAGGPLNKKFLVIFIGVVVKQRLVPLFHTMPCLSFL
ncbi:MAG: hypothetical protein R6U84_09235 [Candidatus Cloacimonadales bacterium]